MKGERVHRVFKNKTTTMLSTSDSLYCIKRYRNQADLTISAVGSCSNTGASTTRICLCYVFCCSLSAFFCLKECFTSLYITRMKCQWPSKAVKQSNNTITLSIYYSAKPKVEHSICSTLHYV